MCPMDGLWRQRIIMENWKVSLNFLPIIIHDGNVGYKEKNVKSLKDVLWLLQNSHPVLCFQNKTFNQEKKSSYRNNYLKNVFVFSEPRQ